MELSAIRQKEECICEDSDCLFQPLNHFQACPKCKSRAFHTVIFQGIKQTEEDE